MKNTFFSRKIRLTSILSSYFLLISLFLFTFGCKREKKESKNVQGNVDVVVDTIGIAPDTVYTLTSELYTADPSAHVFEGKLYVYPSHDFESGIPESFNVLVNEIRSLGLHIELN